MMNMKKKARDELIQFLNKHKSDTNWDIAKNRIELARLVDRQTVLKRKKAEIDKAIKLINGEDKP